MSSTIQIGIDPGTQTGIAIAENGRLRELHTVPIHRAMKIVDEWQTRAHEVGFAFVVYVEDARKRRWYGNNEAAVKRKLQGVGSVKRDCAIWDAFLEDIGARKVMVAPMQNKTKMAGYDFCKLTGWNKKQTSVHARDAAMLVFGRKGCLERFKEMRVEDTVGRDRFQP